MVERIYIRGRPEQLREAVKKDGFVKHFPRVYYYKKSETHIVVKYEFITSGINKTSGKRYYNFKVNRIDSFKIVDGPGRKFLNCYSITFPTKRGTKRRTRKVRELDPRYMNSYMIDHVLDMCKKFIGGNPYSSPNFSLVWYWKPLHIYIDAGVINHHKELRGISARASGVEDLSKKIFGSDSSKLTSILGNGIDLDDVVPCMKLLKRLDPNSDQYPEFARRLLKVPLSGGKQELLKGSEHVPDMFLEKVVYECGDLYLKNLGAFSKFAECIDFSEDSSILVDKLRWPRLLYRRYNKSFKTSLDKELFSDFGFSVVEEEDELIPFVYNNQKSSIFDTYDKDTAFLIYEDATLIKLDDNNIIDGIVHVDGSSVDDSEVRELQNVIHTALT